MTWPNEATDPFRVEIYDGTSWTDVTADTRAADQTIAIRRGFPDEGNTPEPSACALAFNNRDGKYTPRNPNSVLYGLIGRNTPVRVRVTGGLCGTPYLSLDRASGSGRATTPDTAALDITGDIDVRIDLALDEWASAGLAGKYRVFLDARSWALTVTASGFLTFGWSTAGTAGTVLSAPSTVAAGLVVGERKALRVTLDVDNGAGGHTVTFYTAATIDGSWVQLGDPVTDTGTTSIFASAAELQVGHLDDFDANYSTGRVYGFELRSGIDGTEVANPDFTAQDGGATSFADAAGRTWTVDDDAHIHDPGIRYAGEISEWPSRWDVSGNDVWVPVVAQGVLRRLGQGNRPASSPLRSYLVSQPLADLPDYWPMEDTGGRSFASALPNGAPMRWSGEAPELAAAGPVMGSDSFAVLAATTRLAVDLAGAHLLEPAGAIIEAAAVLLDVPPSAGWADGTLILRVHQAQRSGTTVGSWAVRWRTGGDLDVVALSPGGVVLDTEGTFDVNLDNDGYYLELYLRGTTDTTGFLVVRHIDAGSGETATLLSTELTFAGLAPTALTRLEIAPAGALEGLGVGHASVGTASASDAALVSFAGETAAARAERLIEAAGVPFLLIGEAEMSTRMGPQETPSTLIDALNETWAAEQGLMYETRHEAGLTYRTRR